MSSRPEQFDVVVNHLVSKNKEIGEGTHNLSQRPWLDLQELPGGPVGNFDIEGLYKKFDRSDANQSYTNARNNVNALEHEVVVPKLAETFMAGCLRDFVDSRKRSRIRMMVHGGVRQRVNGQPLKGPLVLNTIGYLAAIEGAKKVGTAAPPTGLA